MNIRKQLRGYELWLSRSTWVATMRRLLPLIGIATEKNTNHDKGTKQITGGRQKGEQQRFIRYFLFQLGGVRLEKPFTRTAPENSIRIRLQKKPIGPAMRRMLIEISSKRRLKVRKSAEEGSPPDIVFGGCASNSSSDREQEVDPSM
ncbi:uncharacterized protein LOC129745577 [Uranotaenia lowii]|uniref:uncharacterized protein LOC129745577 n=1 Tax=Uranotaenia lowii TaxID=190385 RepID=UPI00247876D1|nr:uncharacterized protein LOC129745577 [Uranotaenia lowii]